MASPQIPLSYWLQKLHETKPNLWPNHVYVILCALFVDINLIAI